MPRKGPAPSRVILPDPVYGSELLQRFINRLMLDGKKVKAEDIVYTALKNAAEKVGDEPLEVFDKALSNIMARPTRSPWTFVPSDAGPWPCDGL
jgi:small subunit ribosomal protein S7